jgi:hypothetical protein
MGFADWTVFSVNFRAIVLHCVTVPRKMTF